MTEKYKKSLFIFRRDLRLEDNTALIAALQQSKSLIPCFIFDTRQYKDKSYFSSYCFRFLLDSLQDLIENLSDKGSKLYFFNGEAEKIVEKLIKSEKIEAVFFNRDYTPFSRKRDKGIYKIAKDLNVEAHQYADALLNEPENACKDDKTPYTIFTPFFKKNSLKEVKAPIKLKEVNFYTGAIDLADKEIFKKLKNEFSDIETLKGGRAEGLKILKNLSKHEDYQKERDYLALDATTHLSAHNKFGTISIREEYHALVKALGKSHSLVRQLYWRDFFTHIAFHFPHVFGRSFHEKYKDIEWENDKTKFKAWCNGETGYPIVDAAMNEINSTGFMHNRARMVVASFLVKDLHIDWQWGEKYFATKLVDYDPAVNNGSWQWAASTGCDAQPYFRIFNPWLQQEKFDPECKYIKKWLPILKDVPAKTLHRIYKNQVKIPGYPAPIVNHTEAASIAKEMYEA